YYYLSIDLSYLIKYVCENHPYVILL
ncbi:hypothetical protein CSPAE12_00584, partial [Colletotrichum incanum]